ncbi:MAG: lysozyme inhibitor LprI family protein [Prochlorothrix sp.]|nr:lysozyme inhibitor LprI family protein [Prochlorothrix sp.]
MAYFSRSGSIVPLGILVLLTLAACGSAAPEMTGAEEPDVLVTNESTLTAGSRSADPVSAWEITPTGLGPVQVGMTLGEIKETLGPDYTFTDIPNYMVDLGAIEVSREGEVLLNLLYFVYEGLTDTDPVSWIQVVNDRFQTPEGVGPGTSIAAAEAAYGPATLNYNTDNEMREYVNFAAQPEAWSFRTNGAPGTGMLAGLYEVNAGEPYQETQSYQPEAKIVSLTIDGFRAGSTPVPANNLDATPGAGAGLNCGPARTQQNYNACASEIYAAADDQLNAVYQSVRGDLSGPDRDRLTTVQLDWLDFRDLHCEAVTADAEAESAYPMQLNTCLANLTENRTQRLQGSLETGFFSDGRQSIRPGIVQVEGNEINCDRASSTPEINYCAAVAATMAEEQVSLLYQALSEALSAPAQLRLKESQAAWTTYQRNHCEFAVRDTAQGTGYGAFLASCEEALALEQADTLELELYSP